MSDLSGRVIKGYQLRECIGEGGFGVVYRALQPVIEREVAVKVILPEHANQPDFIRHFEFEAQLIARLEHPYIVPLYDYWREPDGAYLVMRLLPNNLRKQLDLRGIWSTEAAARLLDQITAALTVAHRRGVIHRDLKPDNILFDEDDNAYLADFGIAKDLGNPMDFSEDGITGTPTYLAPEQIKSEPVTPQTDIFSIGILLYEILTGQVPFPNTLFMDLLDKQLAEPLPLVHSQRPDLPLEVDDVLQQATAKDPTARYSDALSLAAAFRKALTLHQARPITVTASLENPYKGLRAFQEADAADFFGRQVLTDRLIARLAEHDRSARLLAVVGPSGSGKSSVVHAGLIPALRHGVLPGSSDWFVIEMLPGLHPLQELEGALLRIAVNPPADLLEQLKRDDHGLLDVLPQVLPGDDDSQLVLVIDQFEEVFTLAETEAARSQFLSSLFAAVTDPHSRLRVILTLRADFYDKPLLYQNFGDLIRQRTEVVLPLSATELENAITNPAQRIGMTLELDLVAAIVKDVGEQPGALPLLQYALTELYERRKGRTLTLQVYRDSGGVLGALARRADALYSGLDAAGQEAVRQVFLRLVALGEGAEDTRRRVQRAELASLSGKSLKSGKGLPIDAVIEAYAKYRLLTFDRDSATRTPTVEVAHEALIRTWSRLRDWLNSNREDLRTQRRLMGAATEWNNASRETSFLASGARLDQFESWEQTTGLALNQLEAEYLRASVADRKDRQAKDAARKAKETATAKLATNFQRATLILVAVGVLAIIAIVALGVQAGNADAEIHSAQTRVAYAGQTLTPVPVTLTAVGQRIQISENRLEQVRLAGEANRLLLSKAGNIETAALLSVRALQRGYLPEADAALMRSMEQIYVDKVYSGSADAVYSVAISPDGQSILTGGKNKIAQLWDAKTGKLLRTFAGHTSTVNSVAFSPDGKYVLTGSSDESARLWEIQTGKLRQTYAVQFSPVYSPGHTGRVFAGWQICPHRQPRQDSPVVGYANGQTAAYLYRPY